jgi:hypothetical protein
MALPSLCDRTRRRLPEAALPENPFQSRGLPRSVSIIADDTNPTTRHTLVDGAVNDRSTWKLKTQSGSADCSHVCRVLLLLAPTSARHKYCYWLTPRSGSKRETRCPLISKLIGKYPFDCGIGGLQNELTVAAGIPGRNAVPDRFSAAARV